MSASFDGLDLWVPLHATQISTNGKPLLFMRYDQKAFRCMVCGVYFAGLVGGEEVVIPAAAVQEHLQAAHGLMLKKMEPIPPASGLVTP